MTCDNRVIVVKQYRNGPDTLTLEPPSGGIEPRENILEAAKREFLEETGYMGDLEYAGKLMNNPGSTQVKHVFICQNAVLIENYHLPETDFIELDFTTIPELKELIFRGKTLSTDVAVMALHYLNLV